MIIRFLPPTVSAAHKTSRFPPLLYCCWRRAGTGAHYRHRRARTDRHTLDPFSPFPLAGPGPQIIMLSFVLVKGPPPRREPSRSPPLRSCGHDTSVQQTHQAVGLEIVLETRHFRLQCSRQGTRCSSHGQEKTVTDEIGFRLKLDEAIHFQEMCRFRSAIQSDMQDRHDNLSNEAKQSRANTYT